jgi:hypothetical protein
MLIGWGYLSMIEEEKKCGPFFSWKEIIRTEIEKKNILLVHFFD